MCIIVIIIPFIFSSSPFHIIFSFLSFSLWLNLLALFVPCFWSRVLTTESTTKRGGWETWTCWDRWWALLCCCYWCYAVTAYVCCCVWHYAAMVTLSCQHLLLLQLRAVRWEVIRGRTHDRRSIITLYFHPHDPTALIISFSFSFSFVLFLSIQDDEEVIMPGDRSPLSEDY